MTPKNSLMRPFNWKTTLPGAAAGILAVVALFVHDPSLQEKLLAIAAILGGGGLVAAKDHDK